MRLATAVSKPVLHFICGQNSCVSHPASGDRVLAGSTLVIIFREAKSSQSYQNKMSHVTHILYMSQVTR